MQYHCHSLPCILHQASSQPTGIPYPVPVCSPLWCRPDLATGLHQRGVTENEQTCGLTLWPRPCLLGSLSWLVLLFVGSVHWPLAPKDVIMVPTNDVKTIKLVSPHFQSNIVISLMSLLGSTWNLPSYGKLSYVGWCHHHANQYVIGMRSWQSFHHGHDWQQLCQWIFPHACYHTVEAPCSWYQPSTQATWGYNRISFAYVPWLP